MPLGSPAPASFTAASSTRPGGGPISPLSQRPGLCRPAPPSTPNAVAPGRYAPQFRPPRMQAVTFRTRVSKDLYFRGSTPPPLLRPRLTPSQVRWVRAPLPLQTGAAHEAVGPVRHMRLGAPIYSGVSPAGSSRARASGSSNRPSIWAGFIQDFYGLTPELSTARPFRRPSWPRLQLSSNLVYLCEFNTDRKTSCRERV